MSSGAVNLEVRNGNMYIKNMDWDGAVDAQGKRAAEDAQIKIIRDNKGEVNSVVARFWSQAKNCFVEKVLDPSVDGTNLFTVNVDMNVPGKGYDGVKEKLIISNRDNGVYVSYGITKNDVVGPQPSAPSMPKPEEIPATEQLTPQENNLRNRAIDAWKAFNNEITTYNRRLFNACHQLGVANINNLGYAIDNKYFSLLGSGTIVKPREETLD